MEEPPLVQGIQLGNFDLVLASDGLHATLMQVVSCEEYKVDDKA